MKPNISPKSVNEKVHWAELLPDELGRRMDDFPLVYLPLGLCEPHGEICAYGLDTIKAEWLCVEAARRDGGVVAPTLGYQIHESGYHARWLEDEVGQNNPRMTGMPPEVLLKFFLYQLRAFFNAGFRGVIAVSGHSGGNQQDLRRVTEAFTRRVPGIVVRALSDPELVMGVHAADHAGRYEVSQLLYLRPDLVDFRKADRATDGNLALRADAREATLDRGEKIMNDCLASLRRIAGEVRRTLPTASATKVDYELCEQIWAGLVSQSHKIPWTTARPWPGQTPVTQGSQWKPYEEGFPT